MQNFDHNIVFWEKCHFFRRKLWKSQKIVIITSTPVACAQNASADAFNKASFGIPISDFRDENDPTVLPALIVPYIKGYLLETKIMSHNTNTGFCFTIFVARHKIWVLCKHTLKETFVVVLQGCQIFIDTIYIGRYLTWENVRNDQKYTIAI
jgi:hypothetical protein